MSKKTKTILVIIFLLLAMCSCSTLCVGGTYLLFNSLFKHGPEITNGILYDICSSRGEFTQSKYESWFTNNYQESTNYLETKELIAEIFAYTYDCNEMKTTHFIQMMFKGQSFNIESSIGAGTTASITIPVKDKSITFDLILKQDNWEIDSISTSKYYGDY